MLLFTNNFIYEFYVFKITQKLLVNYNTIIYKVKVVFKTPIFLEEEEMTLPRFFHKNLPKTLEYQATKRN